MTVSAHSSARALPPHENSVFSTFQNSQELGPVEELKLRRVRPPGPEELPLRPGANRPIPSLTDYLAGCRVRRLVAGFVLRVEASRSGVPLHAQALAFKSTSGDNSITDRTGSEGSAVDR